MIKVLVTGAAGRMGSRIAYLVLEDPALELAGAIEREGHLSCGADIGRLIGAREEAGILLSDDYFGQALQKADVIIEFTQAAVTIAHLEKVVDAGKAMVIGTTGLVEEEINKIREVSSSIPIVFSPNMSIGVNLLFKLVGEAAKVLGDEYDVEVIEAHHHHKKDAPSGTAVRIGEVLANSLGRDLKEVGIYGRQGIIGERPAKEIGFSTIRAGDIVGEHTVLFGGVGERLEITHRAHSRDTFAKGAIKAAKFVVGKPPGLYDMGDVLGIK